MALFDHPVAVAAGYSSLSPASLLAQECSRALCESVLVPGLVNGQALEHHAPSFPAHGVLQPSSAVRDLPSRRSSGTR